MNRSKTKRRLLAGANLRGIKVSHLRNIMKYYRSNCTEKMGWTRKLSCHNSPAPRFAKRLRINWLHITQPCRCRGLGRSAEKTAHLFSTEPKDCHVEKSYHCPTPHTPLFGFQVGCLSSFWFSYVIILTYSTSTSLHDISACPATCKYSAVSSVTSGMWTGTCLGWNIPRIFFLVVVGKITGTKIPREFPWPWPRPLGISWRNMVSFGNANADDAPYMVTICRNHQARTCQNPHSSAGLQPCDTTFGPCSMT